MIREATRYSRIGRSLIYDVVPSCEVARRTALRVRQRKRHTMRKISWKTIEITEFVFQAF